MSRDRRNTKRDPTERSLVRIVILIALVVGSSVPAWNQTAGGPIEGGSLDIEEATAASEAIVRGTLSGARTDWVGRKIYTFYDLSVSDTIKGETQKTMAVAVPGGAKGKIASVWAGVPQFAVGDEVVLFGTRFGRGPAFQAIGLFEGLVKVRTNPSTGERFVHTTGRAQNVAEFVQHVRSLVR